MELFLCSILPLMLMLTIWARVKSWSTGRLWYVKLPVLLVSAGAMAGIYYLGKLSAPILYPCGQAVHEEITDTLANLSPDYNALKTNLPDSFKQLVEQVVEVRQSTPDDSIEQLAAKAHGPQFVLTWWRAVAEGDDDHLLEARRKSLALDKLLAKDRPQDCGLRAQMAAPNLAADIPNGIDEANRAKDSAYADSFANGKEAKRQPHGTTPSPSKP